MKISHIRIENILGVKKFELVPGGTLNEIVGTNGEGKTSILEAIKAATQGGHDATLLRQGEDKGEVVLVLDDGTQLHKRVTEGRSSLDLVRDGKKVPRPAEAIRALTDLLSVNPIEFLTAPKRDRVQVLLESMPINVDPARLEEISGIPTTAHPGITGLSLIAAVRQQVYDDRTGTNRAIKEKESTINQLKIALPDVPGGVSGDEDELRASLEAARQARDTETQRIDNKLAGLQKATAERIVAIRAEAQAKIDAIRAEADTAVAVETAALTHTEGLAGKQRQKALDTYAAASEPLNAAIANIVAHRNTFAKRQQTLETIKMMEDQLTELQGDADAQSAALDAVDAYKSEVLNSLPIPGLEVRDGEVFRHGIPFDRLNTAQQVEIAIEIAKLRAGPLAVCCIDRFEALAPDALEEFRKRAAESDMQLFVTRVESGPMQIRKQ